MSRALLFRCFLLLCLSVTFLPGASGCGGGGGNDDGGDNTSDFECHVDKDCENTLVCEDNFCVDGPECSVDADCDEGFECVSEECVEVAGPAPGTEGGECSASNPCEGTYSLGNQQMPFVCNFDLDQNIDEDNQCKETMTGICVIPELRCPRIYQPNSGCDGKCWANHCEREAAGVALDPQDTACLDQGIESLPHNGTVND